MKGRRVAPDGDLARGRRSPPLVRLDPAAAVRARGGRRQACRPGFLAIAIRSLQGTRGAFDSGRPGTALYNHRMLGRGVRLILTLAVLVATGVVPAAPCCAMEGSGPSAVEVRDCCGSDCCRLEKRGPMQADLLIEPRKAGAAAATAFSHPPPVAETAIRAGSLHDRLSFLETDPSPPRGGRDIHLRISLLRI